MNRLLIAVLLLGACADVSPSRAVVLDEFSIDLPDIAVSTGALVVENRGAFTHTLIVSDERGQVMFATGAIQPGATETLPVEFDPGTYQFSCRIVVGTDDGGISDHFERGMVAELQLER